MKESRDNLNDACQDSQSVTSPHDHDLSDLKMCLMILKPGAYILFYGHFYLMQSNIQYRNVMKRIFGQL